MHPPFGSVAIAATPESRARLPERHPDMWSRSSPELAAMPSGHDYPRNAAMGSMRSYAALLPTLLWLAAMPASAQTDIRTTTVEPAMRFGITAGAAHNGAIGDIRRLIVPADDGRVPLSDFSGASGLVPYAGLAAVYAPTGGFGGVLRFSFDDRSVSKTIDGTELAASALYLGIEPGLRLSLGSDRLHLTGGPSILVALRSRFSTTSPAGATAEGEIDGARKVAVALWGELGYDIPLSAESSAWSWYATPFVQASYLFDQRAARPEWGGDPWSTMTIRAGASLTLGRRRVMELPATADAHTPGNLRFTVNVPVPGVVGARELLERMPLVDAIFFDDGSTEIPSRYARIDPADAARFDETSLPEAPSAGGSTRRLRAGRQLAAYHNILNILGARMARHPGTAVTLVGSAADSAEGGAMARAVREYLVGTFGLDASRVVAVGATRPPHSSGTKRTPADDLPLAAEENRRVEIVPSDPLLLDPLDVRSVLEEPFDNDLRVGVKCDEPIDRWSVAISGPGFNRTYGPYTTPMQRIPSGPILGDRNEGVYVARLSMVTTSGDLAIREVSFTLTRKDRAPARARRYAILFDFDESKTVAGYEWFLRSVVAPTIEDGGAVFVHGHTDAIGDEDHNRELSAMRALNAELILEDEVKKKGESVVFDIYGFGENESRAPFPNDTPEGRYYNRTVTVDVVPPEH